MFSYALETIGKNFVIPSIAPAQLPFVIDADTKISECVLIHPEVNEKIEYAHGPFWNFSSDIVVGTFEINQKPIEVVKNELKALVAKTRYAKEVSGTKVTVQDVEVTIDTSRGARDIFAQKYLLMASGETVNWKFPERWLLLSKSDLGLIVNAAVTYIQNQFNWEKDKTAEIDAATTNTQLNAVNLN